MTFYKIISWKNFQDNYNIDNLNIVNDIINNNIIDIITHNVLPLNEQLNPYNLIILIYLQNNSIVIHDVIKLKLWFELSRSFKEPTSNIMLNQKILLDIKKELIESKKLLIKYSISLPVMFGILKYNESLKKNSINKKDSFIENQIVYLLYLINKPQSNGKYYIYDDDSIKSLNFKDDNFEYHINNPYTFDYSMYYKNCFIYINKSKLKILITEKEFNSDIYQNLKWKIVNEIDDIVITSHHNLTLEIINKMLEQLLSWTNKKLFIDISGLKYSGIIDISKSNIINLFLKINTNNFINLPKKIKKLYLVKTNEKVLKKILNNNIILSYEII